MLDHEKYKYNPTPLQNMGQKHLEHDFPVTDLAEIEMLTAIEETTFETKFSCE